MFHSIRFYAISVTVLLALSSLAIAQDSGDSSLESKRQAMNERYTLGPTAASDMKYRITWQAEVDKERGELIDIFVRGNDVFALAPGNQLSRMERKNGKIIWTTTCADAMDTVWGVTQGPPSSASPSSPPKDIYVTTDPVVMVLDQITGAIVGRQDLERIPSTNVVRWGKYLVFGTHSGKIVWHQFLVGQAWKANQLKGPILGAPILVGDRGIAAGSVGGTLLMLDGKTARRVWAKEVYDGITTHVAEGDGLVVVASKDQYLWAFDAGNGNVRWKYFTESPLETAPSVIGDNVLQWIPTEGLVCLELNPGDEIEGRVRWTIKDVPGEIIGTINGNAAIFNQDRKTLTMINLKQGSIQKTYSLPKVRSLKIIDDQLYVIGNGSLVQRLDPIR